MKQPSVISKELIAKNPEEFSNVLTRTIQYNLQTTHGQPNQITAKKPFLTSVMKKKRIDFCNKYKPWAEEEWEGMVFSDESCFCEISSAGKMERCP